MSENIKKKESVESFLSNIPEDIKYFVKHSMDFAVNLSSFLKENKLTQKELADILGKEESEISKWLAGNHNFTLKSISKIEAALDEQLIFTREEISKRFLPYVFRQLKSLYNEEHFNQLIFYYCLSEAVEQEISFLLPEDSAYEKNFETRKKEFLTDQKTIVVNASNTSLNFAA